MRQSSCPLVTEQTVVAVQTYIPPMMTTVIQTKTASPLPMIAIGGELMTLPPWLSSFTPKRKKQEISSDAFDYQQLKLSRSKVAKKAKTICRVTIDSNKMKVAEIVEPIADKPLDEMSAVDYKVTKIELGKQTHEVIKYDAQFSFASLVQRCDDLLAKKDKLEEENRQLMAAVHKITKSAAEGSNSIGSYGSQESICGVERAAQKVQALDSWVDQLHDQCVQVMKDIFQIMSKLEIVEEKLDQTSNTFKKNLESVEESLTIWCTMPQQQLSVLQEHAIISSRVMYLEFEELLENKTLVLKSVIEEIGDAKRFRGEVYRDIVSHCERASCNIVSQDGE